jgi:hypothetical protein
MRSGLYLLGFVVVPLASVAAAAARALTTPIIDAFLPLTDCTTRTSPRWRVTSEYNKTTVTATAWQYTGEPVMETSYYYDISTTFLPPLPQTIVLPGKVHTLWL